MPVVGNFLIEERAVLKAPVCKFGLPVFPPEGGPDLIFNPSAVRPALPVT